MDTDRMIGIGGRWWCFPSAQIDGDSWEGEWRCDGTVYLHDDAGNTVGGTEVDNPEVLAVVPLPSAGERRRREIVLARLMLVVLDMLLSEGHTDLAVKIETAKDVILEFKHTYPEAMNI